MTSSSSGPGIRPVTALPPGEVPEVVISRLPQYVRILSQLLDAGEEVTNSQQLGEQLQVTPAQIRKDLSYFGRFGKQGRGYVVRDLLRELKQILGLNSEWNVAVVGVGRLGNAILNYPGFNPDGFHLVAAFDNNLANVGREVGGVSVQPMAEMAQTVADRSISIAIVAVPSAHTQTVIDQLVACGIRAILNYAPINAQVPDGIRVRSIDPVLALQSMTYYLTEDGPSINGSTAAR
ncbi:Redox-sensing transcriptional repressor Rex [Geodia barretti]|uniref:Redox-sensing transcriptional repressor Rex n=1 Tax=Geodia barretti TaxID=519541 RepID=A0AA35SGH7_GEOBA|nr:Redox-sensing transcriptional repressor Rex [Geodia barretti]